MFTIGQFSKLCQVSVKALHHYDKIDLLHPSHIDEFTGYRYYSDNQVDILLLISRLKRYGFTLAEIKDFLAQSDKRVLFSKLEEHKQQLQVQMGITENIISDIDKHLQSFERTGDIMGYQNNYTIKAVNTEDMALASSRQNMSVKDFEKAFCKVDDLIKEQNLTPVSNGITFYYDEEFHQDGDDNDIEVAVAIKEKDKATHILKGSLCAMTTHKGSYQNLSEAYGSLLKWIDQNGYEIANAPYEIYVKSFIQQLPEDQWETEIYFPIKKK